MLRLVLLIQRIRQLFFFFFFLVNLFILRETRQYEWGRDRERERERERFLSRLHIASAEPKAGLEL